MKNFGKFLIALGLSTLLGYVPDTWAADCFSVSWVGHENWNDSSNWNCNNTARVPRTGDTVEITQDSPIILNQNATVQRITINNGAVLTTDGNSRVLTLTVNSNTTPAFTLSTGGSFTPGNSTVVINRDGTAALTSGVITFNNFRLTPTIGNNRTYTFGTGAVTINGNLDINPTKSSGTTRALTVNMAGGLTVAGTTTIQGAGGSATAVLNTVATANSLALGSVVIGSTGTLTTNGSAVNVTGNLTNNGAFTVPTGSITFSGTSNQTIGGSTATTFNNLTVTNSNGLTLSSSPTVRGTLTLTSGAVTIGGNILTVSSNCTTGITRTNGYVIGNLRLTFPSGDTTCTYHVGSGSSYTPIGMRIITSASGTLTGNTTGSEHPQIASSGLDPAKDANRYWSLGTSGDTLINNTAVSSHAVTLNFTAGDLDSNVILSNFVVGKYVDSAWTLPTPVTAGSTSTGVSSLTGTLASTTDFVVGETTLPSGFRIEVDNTPASTCSTNTKPVITVTVIDSSGNTKAAYTGTVTLSGTLIGGTASSATFSLNSGGGMFTSPNLYQFVASDNSVAKFNIADSTQQDVYVTVSVPDGEGGTISSTMATPVQFRGGTFTIEANDSLGNGVVAGRPHKMRVTRGSGCGTDTSYTGAKTLDGWYTPATEHPNGATEPRICTLNSSNSCLSSAGSNCFEPSIAIPALNASSNNLSVLTFDQGSADFCLVTSDVGKFSLSVRDDSITTAAIVGTSVTFTAPPFAVAVSGITNGTTNNPGANTSTGNVFAKAGASFNATAGGYLWSSAADDDGDGLPDTSASLAQVTASDLAPRYSDIVNLSAAGPITPPGGTMGTLGGSITLAPSGSISTLAYSEVGSFTLAATLASDVSPYYLGGGSSLSNRVVIYSTPGNTAISNAVVGRFIPDHFSLSNGSIINRADLTGCSDSFTYMGERMSASFTLTARNTAGVATANYANFGTEQNYAKLNLTSMTSFSFGAIAGTTSLTGQLNTSGTPAGIWAGGATLDLVVPITLNRPAGVTAPYSSFTLGLTSLAEADGVNVTGLNLDTDGVGGVDAAQIGSTELRFGRLKLSNAHGSEVLRLPVLVEAQHWNGTAFINNTADNCTSILASNIAVALDPAGCTAITASAGTAFAILGGRADLILGKPNLKCRADLTVDLAAENKTYLQGRWSGNNFDQNPTSRATFGIKKGGPVIYLREMY